MKLTAEQSERFMKVWNAYLERGGKYTYPGTGFTHAELDLHRRALIPELQKLLERFVYGSAPIEEFRSAIEEINQKNLLWGFQGQNGQVFFNSLVKLSLDTGKIHDLNYLLKGTLPAPVNADFAVNNIRNFVKFMRAIPGTAADPATPMRMNSIPFFLSYFWQIQKADKWPIYYATLVNELKEQDIWTASGELTQNYTEFTEVHFQAIDLVLSQTNKEVRLWDIEHALWTAAVLRENNKVNGLATTPESVEEKPAPDTERPAKVATPPTTRHPRKSTAGEHAERKQTPIVRAAIKPFMTDAGTTLPESYLPPVVAILPNLAANDSQASAVSMQSGKTVEQAFDERLAILFGMLGFEHKGIDRGYDRAPTGVAMCPEHHYAIIYDGEVQREGLALDPTDSDLRGAVIKISDRLRRQGYRTVYFMVISNAFVGDFDEGIRSLRMETGVNEVLLVEVSALLQMLEARLKDREVNLGPRSIQKLLASSGVLGSKKVRGFFG